MLGFLHLLLHFFIFISSPSTFNNKNSRRKWRKPNVFEFWIKTNGNDQNV